MSKGHALLIVSEIDLLVLDPMAEHLYEHANMAIEHFGRPRVCR